MDTKTLRLLQGAAGAAGGSTGTDYYNDDVFVQIGYKGNSGSGHNLTGGFDYEGESQTGMTGGMVMIKEWDNNSGQGEPWTIVDTKRGKTKLLETSSNAQESTDANAVESFNTDGITVGSSSQTNGHTDFLHAWCFRNREKFFTTITYTGNGSNQSIAHDLNAVPGMIWVKQKDGQRDWGIYHRKQNAGSNPQNYGLKFDNGYNDSTETYWNSTAPTSSHFTVGSDDVTNKNGQQYVAYLFAHNESAFGPDENKPISSCGNYIGNAGTKTVTLGWEPQLIILKKTSSGGNGYWYTLTNLTGYTAPGGAGDRYNALQNNMQTGGYNFGYITSDGFVIEGSNSDINENGGEMIFYAVRKADGVTGKGGADDPTNVFKVGVGSNAVNEPNFRTSFPVEMGWYMSKTTDDDKKCWFRKINSATDGRAIMLNNGSTYHSDSEYKCSHFSNGFITGAGSAGDDVFLAWKASRGFDTVSWKGNGSSGRQLVHNLGQTPEFMVVRRHDGVEDWTYYHKGANGGTNPANYYGQLNGSGSVGQYSAIWYNTMPTSTHFTVGNHDRVNSSYNYTIMLFASVTGVCKTGSYTGSTNAQTISLGFKPKVLITKSMNSSGQWTLLSTSFGWTEGTDGNDNYFKLNDNTNSNGNTAGLGESTATGFTLPAGQNINNDNGVLYLYYAHA